MEVATLEAPMWHNQSILFVRAAALFSESVKPLQSAIIVPFTIYHAEAGVVDELFQTAFKERALFFLDLYRIDTYALV